jgi:hypothetical protein
MAPSVQLVFETALAVTLCVTFCEYIFSVADETVPLTPLTVNFRNVFLALPVASLLTAM